jgi:hypothetical protein
LLSVTSSKSLGFSVSLTASVPFVFDWTVGSALIGASAVAMIGTRRRAVASDCESGGELEAEREALSCRTLVTPRVKKQELIAEER